jgi:hypothetical protein
VQPGCSFDATSQSDYQRAFHAKKVCSISAAATQPGQLQALTSAPGRGRCGSVASCDTRTFARARDGSLATQTTKPKPECCCDCCAHDGQLERCGEEGQGDARSSLQTYRCCGCFLRLLHTSHLTPHTLHTSPHTSHLTPHTSHLTPHSTLLTLCTSHTSLHSNTSHLTHNTSHTSHLSQHLAPHTLQLTPHTSHLTPHTSHLTPHTSHLTPHTSHLTPHTSHLTPHTSHLSHSYSSRRPPAPTRLPVTLTSPSPPLSPSLATSKQTACSVHVLHAPVCESEASFAINVA